MRVAAVDCGTNSIRLLVTDVDPAAGTQHDLDRRLRIVRLGQDVDRTGVFSPEALSRTFEACDEYAEVCRGLGVTCLRVCATSAARDASNAAELATGVRRRLGVEPEVISGPEEARLTALGAIRSLTSIDPDTLDSPVLVVDIGGGSTELVIAYLADGSVEVTAAVSVDVGAVRLTERHLASDPPSADEVDRARRDVDGLLDAAGPDVSQVRGLVGVGGTITTVAAHAMDLPRYDPSRIDGARLPLPRVTASCRTLLHASVAERRAMPFMHPGRADVIGAGGLLLERIVVRTAERAAVSELVVSEHDILDGIAWSLVGAP